MIINWENISLFTAQIFDYLLWKYFIINCTNISLLTSQIFHISKVARRRTTHIKNICFITKGCRKNTLIRHAANLFNDFRYSTFRKYSFLNFRCCSSLLSIFSWILKDQKYFRRFFSILTIHNHFLESCEVPQKFGRGRFKPFWR